MTVQPAKKINRVLLVGGTHGNESTGVFLINKWMANPELLAGKGIEVETLLANPEAIRQNRRYVDKDLNRCFSSAVLNDDSLSGVEIDLAHALVQQLGAKGESQYDLIIDLHTSTAKMQTNLVLTKHDRFHLSMMAYMQQLNEQVVVTSEAELIPDHHFLCALADHNVIVEVGPVAQGLLQHSAIQTTERAVYQILDFVGLWNEMLEHDSLDNNNSPQDDSLQKDSFQKHSHSLSLTKPVEVFSYTGKIYFPEDEAGNIIGYLHPDVDGRDYSQIESGTPLFIGLDEQLILYTGEPTYISFVNEAAYYDQKIALCTLEKHFYSVTDLEDASA